MGDQFTDDGCDPIPVRGGDPQPLVNGGRHWDCFTPRPSAALLLRMMRGLMRHGGKLLDTSVLPNRKAVSTAPRQVGVIFLLWLPEGEERHFATYVGVRLRRPPRASL